MTDLNDLKERYVKDPKDLEIARLELRVAELEALLAVRSRAILRGAQERCPGCTSPGQCEACWMFTDDTDA